MSRARRMIKEYELGSSGSGGSMPEEVEEALTQSRIMRFVRSYSVVQADAVITRVYLRPNTKLSEMNLRPLANYGIQVSVEAIKKDELMLVFYSDL